MPLDPLTPPVRPTSEVSVVMLDSLDRMVHQLFDRLEGSWNRWREVMAGQSDWWSQLGEAWGPWSRHSVADMVEHAGNELVHHGAEIALLRDLYRERN